MFKSLSYTLFIILISNFHLRAMKVLFPFASFADSYYEGSRIMKDYMAKNFKLFLSSCTINYPTPPPIPATSTLNAACVNFTDGKLFYFRESREENKFLSFISLDDDIILR